MANGASIQPIVISTYTGHVSLRRFRAGTIAIKVLPPIDMAKETNSSLADLIEQVKNQMQVEIDALDRLISA